MKVTDEMVNRFLGWKLPEDFHPDCGISFTPHFNVEWNAKQGKPPQRYEPVGTNLFTAGQARAMLEHVLALAGSESERWIPCAERQPKPLQTVLMTNGEWTSTGFWNGQLWFLDVVHESDPGMSPAWWMPVPESPK